MSALPYVDWDVAERVGIELVRAWCEDMAYKRVKSTNRLRLKLPRRVG